MFLHFTDWLKVPISISHITVITNHSSKWKFEFTGLNQILEFIFTCLVLNKNWKMYWSEQSFTGLGPEDRCSTWGLSNFKWTKGTIQFFFSHNIVPELKRKINIINKNHIYFFLKLEVKFFNMLKMLILCRSVQLFFCFRLMVCVWRYLNRLIRGWPVLVSRYTRSGYKLPIYQFFNDQVQSYGFWEDTLTFLHWDLLKLFSSSGR